MKCDELKAINAYQLTTNTEDSDVYIHNDEFGCGGDLVECYLKSEVDEAIAELKAKLKTVNELVKTSKDMYDRTIESLKAIHYAEMVDAGMRERRLKRALWLARANSAEGQFFYWCARFGVESGFTKADIRGYSVNTKRRLITIGEWIETWKNVKHKCLKKAELYK